MRRFRKISVEELLKMIPMASNIVILEENGDGWYWMSDYVTDRFENAAILIEEPEITRNTEETPKKPQKDDRWIEAKDYPQVGDEIEDKDDGERFVVVKIQEELKKVEGISFFVMDQTGLTAYLPEDKCNYFRKTGRHFPQIKEVLDLLKEGGKK